MGEGIRSRLDGETVFKAFKYTVYFLLTVNLFFWIYEDWRAAQVTFADGIGLHNFIDAFPATVDTFWWVVLLLLFELETAVIPDEKLRGKLKWALTAVRAVAYFFIFMAFLGYWNKLVWISQLQPFEIDNVCSLIGGSFNYVFDLDEYYPIDAEVCAAMAGEYLFRIAGTDIVGTGLQMDAAIRLALTDVVNAADWLIIVMLLELEVWLQLKDRLTDRLIAVFKWIKGFLYAILFLAAIYWGVKGDFLDFWDAFLWLVAFIFIELNIFQWHEEVEEEKLERDERLATQS